MGTEIAVIDRQDVTEPIWTRFSDSHSLGYKKEAWDLIYIQAPEDEAEIIFYNRFGHSPRHVTCSCCGPDYSSWELGTDVPTDVKESQRYGGNRQVLVIPADVVKPEERKGSLPRSGWVCVDREGR